MTKAVRIDTRWIPVGEAARIIGVGPGYVRILVDTGRLRIAPALRYAEALREELKGFQVELSATGRDSYGAAAGLHDDLVIALSLAAREAARDVEHHLRHPVREVPPDFSIFQL